MRCPGQDMRFWKPGDIFETQCPKCGARVEFFKDEVKRRCRCGHEIVNSKLDLGCAQWCPYAEQCQIVYEADWLVNIEEEGLSKDRENVEKIVGKVFKTVTGKQLAEQRYLR